MRSTLLSILVALLALAVLPAAFAETYKWVDKNGVTHYSDRPSPGAVKVEIQETHPSSSPPTSQAAHTPDTSQPAADFKYREIDLFRPKNDEVFTNAGNTVSVAVRVDPGLQATHSIWLYMDGKRVDGQSGTSLSFEIKDVWRGTHTVLAVITDGSGKRLISSQSVTFHVRQTSVLAPKPAGR